jgi:O-antigen ligase/polysaccharide polymerase Wzy-like membrane protein
MWLLLAMIMIMPYEANPYLYLGENLLGIFPDFTVIKALGLLGFAWAGLRLAAGDPAGRLLGTRPARLFFAFLGVVAVVAVAHGTGFQYAISRYLGFLVFLPFVIVAVRTQRDLGRVLAAMVLSYVLVFPYAVRQMVRFGDRLGIGLYETNYLATILVLLVPLAFALASQQHLPMRRALWTGCGLVLVLMVFLTSSRGGFVGLLAAGMVFVYRRRGLGGAATVMLVLLGSVLLLPTDLGSRALATIFQDSSQLPAGLEQSNRAHVALFWAALRMIADSPLIGVGPLNFKSLSTLYTGLEQGNIAHNSFLEIAAEFGLPALVVFVMLLHATFRTLGRATRPTDSPQARELAGWAEGLRSGLIGFLVAGCFISAQYEKILWLAVFLTIVLGALVAHRAHLDAWAAEEAGPELVPVPEPAP